MRPMVICWGSSSIRILIDEVTAMVARALGGFDFCKRQLQRRGVVWEKIWFLALDYLGRKRIMMAQNWKRCSRSAQPWIITQRSITSM